MSAGRIPLGLTIMQILCIDLGTDMVPALGLGAERPEPGLMDRPPRSPGEHVITRSMLLRAYGFLGLLSGAAAMAAFFAHYWMNGYAGRWLDLPASGQIYRAATALALASVVATHIGNLFAHRTSRLSIFQMDLFGNRLLWIGVASELVFLCLVVYTPGLQWVFGTAPIPAREWGVLVAMAPLLLVADELRKAFLRRRDRRREGGMS